MRFRVFVCVLCVMSTVGSAADNESEDLVAARLENAKSQYEQRVADAKSQLGDDIAKLIVRTENNGRLSTEEKIAALMNSKQRKRNS